MRNAIAVGIIAAVLGGCGMGPEYTAQQGCPPGYAPAQAAPVAAPASVYANPIFIPIADPQCAWETIVDVVDDYFRIDMTQEEPTRMVNNVPTEGSFTTFPEVSPTIFEPWRHDTVDSEQRLENTMQTMRRFAAVHATPAQGGYLVEITVSKQLEDNIRPDQSTVGSATFRYDSTLTGIVNPINAEPTTEGWISRGRDASMEQHIIGHLLSRCGQSGSPGVVVRGQDR